MDRVGPSKTQTPLQRVVKAKHSGSENMRMNPMSHQPKPYEFTISHLGSDLEIIEILGQVYRHFRPRGLLAALGCVVPGAGRRSYIPKNFDKFATGVVDTLMSWLPDPVERHPADDPIKLDHIRVRCEEFECLPAEWWHPFHPMGSYLHDYRAEYKQLREFFKSNDFWFDGKEFTVLYPCECFDLLVDIYIRLMLDRDPSDFDMESMTDADREKLRQWLPQRADRDVELNGRTWILVSEG